MSTIKSSANVPLIFGASDFGDSGVKTLPEAQALVDVVIAHGLNQFDTSNFYAEGESEKFLGQLDLKGALVDTKVFPLAPGDHAPKRLRAAVLQSAKTLGHSKINVLYLHAPDAATPLSDTLGEINELFKEGHFAEFGISNFSSTQVPVDEFHAIAKKNGWIAPTVYQGPYNLLQREVEDGLINTLRKHKMRFFGYSPLGMGLLARHIQDKRDFVQTYGGRWDPTSAHPIVTDILSTIYAPYLPAIIEFSDLVKTHNLNGPNIALRWLQHHSILTSSDAILIAGSSVERVRSNIADSESGPLSVEVLKLLEDFGARNKARIANEQGK